MDYYCIGVKSIFQKAQMITYDNALFKSTMTYHQQDTLVDGRHMNLSLEITGGQECLFL